MTEIHIINLAGTHCAACGDAIEATTPYVGSIGYWNTLSDRCEPTKIMRPDYTLVTRSPDRDNQTAAMKEDIKNPKRKNQKIKGDDR